MTAAKAVAADVGVTTTVDGLGEDWDSLAPEQKYARVVIKAQGAIDGARRSVTAHRAAVERGDEAREAALAAIQSKIDANAAALADAVKAEAAAVAEYDAVIAAGVAAFETKEA